MSDCEARLIRVVDVIRGVFVFYIYFHHHLELCLHCTRVHRLVRRAINLTSPKTLCIGLSDAEAIELTFANGSVRVGSRLREPIPVAMASPAICTTRAGEAGKPVLVR